MERDARMELELPKRAGGRCTIPNEIEQMIRDELELYQVNIMTENGKISSRTYTKEDRTKLSPVLQEHGP